MLGIVLSLFVYFVSQYLCVVIKFLVSVLFSTGHNTLQQHN